MIPLKKQVEVSLSEDFKTSDFTMENSPEAYEIMSNTMYTDKVYAVVREYMTNAADAHIEAGHTREFEVKLPTVLDPTFSVKDFGLGLSHDQVLKYFTKFFSSSKKKSNSQTGYLGLGCKSIFAYTDSGFVTTTQDGVTNVYALSKTPDGVPQVSLLSSEESDGPTGTTVSFVAEQTDVKEFKVAAQRMRLSYRGLEIQPKFNLELGEPPIPLYEDETFTIYKNDDISTVLQTARKGVFINQGPVLYPYHFSAGVSWLSSPYYYTVFVRVPIGTAAPAASREALSEDPQTKLAIEAEIQSGIASIKKVLEAELAKQPSHMHASIFAYNNYTSWYSLCHELEYNGQALSSSITYPLSSCRTFQGKQELVLSLPWTRKIFYTKKGLGAVAVAEMRGSRFFYGGDIHLVDVSKSDLRKLKKDLLLSDDHFLDLAEYKTPKYQHYEEPPKRRLPKNEDKKLHPYIVLSAGIYEERYEWMQSKLPEDGEYYWLPVNRKGGTIEWPYDDDAHSTVWAGRLKGHIESMNKMLLPIRFREKYIFFMTKKVQEELQPSLDKRLDVALQKHVKPYLAYLKTPIVEQKLLSTVRSDSSKIVMQLLDVKNTRNERTYHLVGTAKFLSSLFPSDSIMDQLEVEIKMLKELYPALFQRDVRSGADFYIQAYTEARNDLINTLKESNVNV